MNKSPNMDTADRWFSQAIRWRDNWTCRFCGRVATDVSFIDCAHIVGRRDKACRWEASNAVTLCRDHHRYFGEHPAEFEDWVKTWMTVADWDALQRQRRMVLKVNAARIKDIAAHYRAEARRMEQQKTHDLAPWVPYELYALRA